MGRLGHSGRLLEVSRDAVSVAVGPDHCLKFTGEGVVYGYLGSPNFAVWARVSDLRLLFPAARTRSWSVVQTILETLAPVDLRSNQTRVYVETFDRGREILELGYPHRFGATVPLREAISVEAAVDQLSHQGQLRRLGEPDFVTAMMQRLPTVSPVLASVTTWRVNRLVDSLL